MKIVTLLRKPLDSTVAANSISYGTGGVNIDGSRIGTTEQMSFSKAAPFTSSEGAQGRTWNPTSTPGMDREQHTGGRWPANLILTEDTVSALDSQSGVLTSGQVNTHHMRNNSTQPSDGGFNGKFGDSPLMGYGDSGGASRFFKQVQTTVTHDKETHS